jgi:DNA repair protein RadA/Sms
MAKARTQYVCSSCGGVAAKWAGRCAHCGEWNTLQEVPVEERACGANRFTSWSGERRKAAPLKDVQAARVPRIDTGLAELNRVLGGGLVPGSVTLVGGDPGIGKSTLLLQTLATVGAARKVLYVTGEESLEQVALRAERLYLGSAPVKLAAEIELEAILALLEEEQPDVVVIDSVQTLYSGVLQAAPGSVSQVRECAAHLVRYAKSHGAALFLVGHVTKEGALAGPRVLEHMVDTVLYFEGDPSNAFRMLRVFKNRYGAANEIGVFAMGAAGLEEVDNPSSMFLTAHEQPVPGSVVLCALEGRRPLLVEVQALVEDTQTPNPKRFAQGVDVNRVQMLLAVLSKHADITAVDQNVYVKVVGGVRITEPAADLAVLLSAWSSLTGRKLPEGMVVFGEVGLAGELRAVSDPEARLKEAAKLGFSAALMPAANKMRRPVDGIRVLTASRVDSALSALRSLRVAA